jgi:hypothetical protein
MLLVGTMRVTFTVRKASKQTTPQGYLEPQDKTWGFLHYRGGLIRFFALVVIGRFIPF